MDVKEKLMEILGEFLLWPSKMKNVWMPQGIEKLADHLISHGVTVQEWISVDDRLPDETGRYLAVKKRIAPDTLGGNRTDIVIIRFFEDSGFKIPIHIPDWINEEIKEEVTHWMPLPELPKGDNDAESID